MTVSTLTIEEILSKTPEDIRRIYEEDLRILKTGILAEKRQVAQRHALYFFDFEAEKAALICLQKEAKEGKIDALTLEAVANSPSFERIRRLPDGKILWHRGMTVEGFEVIGSHVLTTIYSVFDDDARRKRAAQAQEFTNNTTELARKQADDIELIAALETFMPLSPVYSDKNILVNLFVDGQNLHDALKKADIAKKHEHLAMLARIDAALHHFAKGRKTKFEPIDHAERLITKGVARNYPAYAERLKKNSVFTSIFADLQGIQSFVHGDALPSNTMITWRESPDGPTPVYHPIDFEEACLDFVEAPLVQRLVKSGIYNEKGESMPFGESTVEAAVLNELQAQAKKLDPSFDVEASNKRFNALKAEQYLIWASRYRAAADVTNNRSELIMLSRYYYTLFCREVSQQGRVKDVQNLDELSSLFQPLDSHQMREAHNSLQPQNRSISAFKVDTVGNAESKLEEMMKNYNSRKRWRLGGRIAAGIALFGALAGGIFGYKAYTETQQQLQKAELKGKYAAKVHIIRLSQTSGSAYSTDEVFGLDELKMWKKRFKENEQELAYAAFIDYAELYRVMKSVNPETPEFKREVLSKLPDDLRFAMLDTEYIIDNWIYSPQANGLFPEEKGKPYETARERGAWEKIEKTVKAAEAAFEEEQRLKALKSQTPTNYIPSIGDVDKILYGDNK